MYGKRPNFGLIVALSALAILVILVAAYFFAKKDSGDVVPKIHRSLVQKQPQSLTV